MSTVIRPEISEKRDWYIEKHRFYELKHFCLQYPTWEKRYNAADGFEKNPMGKMIFAQSNNVSDPTARCAEIKAYYAARIDMLVRAAEETDPVIGNYILRGILEEKSYDAVRAMYDVPCCKDVYYNLYRKFFWILSRERN